MSESLLFKTFADVLPIKPNFTMDKATAIASIREKLVQGDIETALEILIANLEANRRQFRDLSNRALQAKAQLEKTQRDEQQGVISFENSKLSYNQITQQVLSIVDEWEHPDDTAAATARKISPQMIMIAVLMLGVIGMIGFRMLKNKGGAGGTASVQGCPKFEKNARFNILVLPFFPVRDPIASPHRNLARRLDEFKGQIQDKITTSVRFKDDPVPDLDDDAIRYGEDCQAKLVIWGGAEKVSSPPDGAIITTKYKYLFSDETFAFTKLGLDDNISVIGNDDNSSIPTQGSFIDTITSYTTITQNGSLSNELENQIRLLFGVATMQSGDPKGALDILESAEITDSISSLLRDMAIAESHFQMKDTAAAVEAYDRALQTHPDYWFALNNRALIYYKKGDYAEALKNLDQQLDNNPESVEALTIRGAVKTKTKQFQEAEEDLLKARKLDSESAEKEQTPYINKKLKVLEREKVAEEKRRDRAITQLKASPNDLTALTHLAESSRNLGDYQTADRAATKLIRIDPNNLRALAVKVEAAAKIAPRSAETTRITQRVENLSPEIKTELIKERPILSTIINQRDPD
jgi:tetratricopeptide (TPR) repeat protein